jgi:8-oxo-dGTP pyrophosphatase MutT (NUDIX family)
MGETGAAGAPPRRARAMARRRSIPTALALQEIPMSDRPDWMQPHGRSWTCLTREPVFDNPWIRLDKCETVAPTGRPAHYGMVHFKNRAIGVLPLFENGDILLVGQHRFTTADYSWEIPEGGGPLSEDPLVAAKRELREETGLAAADWRQVMRFHLSNSVTDEEGYGFLALGLSEGAAAPDETEALAIRRLPFHQALRLALEGAMLDMITLTMLLRAYYLAREGLLPDTLAREMLR